MSLDPTLGRSFPVRALLACGVGGKTIVLSTDSGAIAYDIDGIENDADELGLPSPKGAGLWLFDGSVKWVDGGSWEGPPEPEPEYAGELRPVEPAELAGLLAMSPPEPEDGPGE